MSEKNSLPFDGENSGEKTLWDALDALPEQEPSPRLRQRFYRELEKSGRPGVFERLREFLGFKANSGWLTVAASMLLGLGTGMLLVDSSDDQTRLAALEENVSMLSRSLILDRLENDTASKRLRGVIDAADMAGSDTEIANALLYRATNDPVPSIRSAAIGALGPQLQTPAVGERLMELLQKAESPLVQLALVDLVLRHGTEQQIIQLAKLADDGLLHPDIAQHVASSLEGDII